MEALRELRGGQRVTDQNAEDRYGALRKYARDLTAMAEAGKRRPRDRPRRRDPARGAGAVAPHEEQPRPDRRPRRRQDRHRRGPGAAHRHGRRARRASRAGASGRSTWARCWPARSTAASSRSASRPCWARSRPPRARPCCSSTSCTPSIGAGAAEGAVDAANLLKPMLARGELRAIGATTLDEYRKHVEKDAALARRFQPVLVGEPSWRTRSASCAASRSATRCTTACASRTPRSWPPPMLSDRYISDRFLPDKAIDLIDEAASRLRIEIDSHAAGARRRSSGASCGWRSRTPRWPRRPTRPRPSAARRSPPSSPTCARRPARCARAGRREKHHIEAVQRLKGLIEDAKAEAERAEREADLQRAARLRYGDLPALESELEAESRRAAGAAGATARCSRRRSTPRTSPRSWRAWTGIPVTRLMEGELEKLVHLEERLHDRVVGQDEAIGAVADAIRRSRAGLGDPNRPHRLVPVPRPHRRRQDRARQDARRADLFDDERAMVRIDMTEYMERHAVSRLVGRAARATSATRRAGSSPRPCAAGRTA